MSSPGATTEAKPKKGIFLQICWVVTLLFACLAAVLLLLGAFAANGAPQEAAVGAIAAAIVVVPYVFTRAIEGLS